MNRLRKACGIEKGSKDFIQDGFRKTFATAIHKIRPSSEYDYWLRCCSHSATVHATFYKNPSISKKDAHALFEIHPPDLQAELDKQNAEREARIKSIMEEYGFSRDDAEGVYAQELRSREAEEAQGGYPASDSDFDIN